MVQTGQEVELIGSVAGSGAVPNQLTPQPNYFTITLRPSECKKRRAGQTAKPLIFLVPEVGIEPTLSQGKGDLRPKNK